MKDVRRLALVQRYAMPQYVLLYRPGKAEVRCVGERGVVVYLNVLVYVSALNGDGLKRQLSEWINSKAVRI